MQLERARIKNFRSLRNVEVAFGAHTAFIGGNGAGKSSILKAIEKFYSTSKNCDADDYFGRDQGQPIEIELTFHQLSDQEAASFEGRVRDGKLVVTRIFDGGTSSGRYHGVVPQIPDFVAIRSQTAANPKRAAYNALRDANPIYAELPNAASAAAVDQALLEWEANHPAQLVLLPDDGQFFGFQNNSRGKLQRHTSFVFIPAVREASADAADGKTSVIGKLLELLVRGQILQRPDVQAFKAQMTQAYQTLVSAENMPELGTLAGTLTADLRGLYQDAEVALNWREIGEMPVPLPMADVLLKDDGFGGPVDRQGHGLQRAFIFTLLQHLARTAVPEADDPVAGGGDGAHDAVEVVAKAPTLILAIEEPELYQHPTKQRHFAEVLRGLSSGALPGVQGHTQIIFGSHSPMFISMGKADEIRLARRSVCADSAFKQCSLQALDLDIVAQKLERGWDKPAGSYSAQTLMPRLHILGAELAEGFFANGVILVEGRSDKAALTATARMLGVNFEAAGIAILSAEGKANLDRPYVIFRELGIPTFLLWDCDQNLPEAQRTPIIDIALSKLAMPETVFDTAPIVDLVSDCYAHFGTTLEHRLKADLTPEVHASCLAAACAPFGVTPSNDTQKIPQVVYETLLRAKEQGRERRDAEVSHSFNVALFPRRGSAGRSPAANAGSRRMIVEDGSSEHVLAHDRRAQGPWSDLALHTIGWRAFQDLCSQVCEVVLGRPVEVFREAQDGGQDAVFLVTSGSDAPPIGTVQCKHTSDAGKALRIGDLSSEIENVEKLVKAGQADTYAFMTNMSVDAPVAAAMRKRLRDVGVRKPHILGRQYIVRAIRSSARLRALVPQVYGLGDLTSIVDERLSEQSRALLDSWVPKLRTYVPTTAHRDAVNAISNHGVVLLLGNPSSGKSAIGAIVSTIATENPDNTVLALTSPRDFEKGWNPNDPGRFFWIDDAFGSNVLREDYVQDWASAFSKLRAAINHGNRFLLTSRKHIYEAARRRLGQRNLAQFADGSAVVDVGDLSFEEKAQILYNHVNFGEQSQSWRSSVKLHLPAVAAVKDFLPGIAERLGDPNFTKGLAPRESSLVRFMEAPTEHLIDTINALDDRLQAALILVYVHNAGFDPGDHDTLSAQAVAELTGYSISKIQDCFAELKGSFLKLSGPRWTFAHPTISDALTEIMRQKPHMMAALIRGAPINTILGTFTCEGSPLIRDALVIHPVLDEALVARLGRTPDERHLNWLLFHFLSYRASEVVFAKAIEQFPNMLRRSCWPTELVGNDPQLAAYARANRLGLLPNDLRLEAAGRLETAAHSSLDVSFFEEEEMLALISPLHLIGMGMALRTVVLPSLEVRIDEIAADADLDEEPDSHFKKLLDILERIEALGVDAAAATLIEDARDQIRRSVDEVEERKRERDEETDSDADWTHIVTQKKEDAIVSAALPTTRSIFDDVDK